MSVAIRAITRLQDADDFFAATLGAGEDGHAIVWNNDAGVFGLMAVGDPLWEAGSGLGAIQQPGVDADASGKKALSVGGIAGWGNTVSGAYAQAIGGFSNTVSGVYAQIIGASISTASGYMSQILGGNYNTASDIGTHVTGGCANTASGYYANVVGGYWNTATGYFAQAIAGAFNTASGSYAIVLGGLAAVADKFAQISTGAWPFPDLYLSPTDTGQTSQLLASEMTTGLTPTELTLNGSDQLTIATNGTWLFDVSVVARRRDAAGGAGYRFEGVLTSDDSVVAFIGSPSKTVIAESDGAWDCEVQANNIDKALSVVVTGAADQTIWWIAMVRLTEAYTPSLI